MKRWRFETNRISSVATAQPQSQKPVFDFDLTWWPDLWWPGAEIFTQGVKFNCEQVLKKWRRCAPPFFRYPRKTGGVGIFCPPPPVRVLRKSQNFRTLAPAVKVEDLKDLKGEPLPDTYWVKKIFHILKYFENNSDIFLNNTVNCVTQNINVYHHFWQ